MLNYAGIVGAPASERNPSLSAAINCEGPKNLVEALNEYNDNIPLYFSGTGSIYGKLTEICTEDSKINPQSLYGIHKKIGEDETLKYKNGLAFRLATIMGVSGTMRVNLLVNNLVMDAYYNKHITVAEPDMQRTFLDIRDATRGVICAMESFNMLHHKVYNLGDNRLNYSKRQIAEKIKEKTGCDIFYSDFIIDSDKRDYRVSYQRIQQDLDFQAQYTLDDTINDLLKAVPLIQIRHQYV